VGWNLNLDLPGIQSRIGHELGLVILPHTSIKQQGWLLQSSMLPINLFLFPLKLKSLVYGRKSLSQTTSTTSSTKLPRAFGAAVAPPQCAHGSPKLRRTPPTPELFSITAAFLSNPIQLIGQIYRKIRNPHQMTIKFTHRRGSRVWSVAVFKLRPRPSPITLNYSSIQSHPNAPEGHRFSDSICVVWQCCYWKSKAKYMRVQMESPRDPTFSRGPVQFTF
jgi:hypothetical protein